jgi:hypothetical protein
MSESSLIKARERRITRAAALVFVLALVLGGVLWANRLRMLFAITQWQEDSTAIASTSGTISVSKLGCPFALGESEPASVSAVVSNDWTREVGIEVSFYTEDLSNGTPYAYINGPPLCGPVLVNVAPGKTARISCDFEQKTVSQGMMMPLAVKARTVFANFGPSDYDSAACPIWIVDVPGVKGEVVANMLGLISLLGMVLSASVWAFGGFFPGDPVPQFGVVMLWVAGAVVAAGTLIYVIHEAVSCGFLAGLVIVGVVWAATRDRRRQPIRSIFE